MHAVAARFLRGLADLANKRNEKFRRRRRIRRERPTGEFLARDGEGAAVVVRRDLLQYFVEHEPRTSWNLAAPDEYGFYANVNPAVDHPRWSQKRERRIGDWLKRDTLPFNGYGEQVASLYSGMDLKKYF